MLTNTEFFYLSKYMLTLIDYLSSEEGRKLPVGTQDLILLEIKNVHKYLNII